MTCSCNYEFCFNCLGPWSGKRCSRGCELWVEANLVDAGERRVQAMEHVHGRIHVPAERRQVLRNVMDNLEANERCEHDWNRVNGRYNLRTRECDSCEFEMYVYGYECQNECQSTVCHTCRFHRLPPLGWR